MTPQNVELGELQPEIEQLMGFLLRNKPVSFSWQVSPNLPPVWVDQQKLMLVLQNLLSNAVKFTEQGKIEVWAEPNGKLDEVTLEVRDMGVGIAPENHEAIFELFQRVDESSTHCFGGTGVGLTLARKLARMMDGDISVKSRLGEGATFILKLKVSPEFSSSYCTSSPL